jgi:hypothetical protein
MVHVIIFGSVRFLSKKNNQTGIFFKKTEIGSSRPVSVRFLKKKPVWLGFFGLARFFSCLTRFFSVWVRFSFFGFRLVLPKLNLTGRFFQNSNRFNWFFFTVWFFQLFFFSGFLGLICFSVFLLTPTKRWMTRFGYREASHSPF